MKLSHKKFIKTSIPFTLSTVAASLMGAVDTAVVGHLGNYTYINAVSLGAVIFSTVYWLFGFLKISTSGFAAQALGQHNPKLLAGAFLRGVLAAFGIGVLLVALQEPIWQVSLLLFQPEAATAIMLEQYYRLLIWIMPLTLVFQTAQGWFAGTLHVRIAVFTALASNLLNLLLDVLFVLVFHLDVLGVAAATCIANIVGFTAILYFYYQHKPLPLRAVALGEIFSGPTCRQMLQCGSHLTVRMLCMIIMVNSFMHQSSLFGGELLAANAILFQIQFIMGDILTGLSQAGAIYSGIAFGERNRPMLKDTLRISCIWALGFGLAQSVGYYLCRHAILSCFTDLPQVIFTAQKYDIFIAFFPLLSALGIVYYGVFNGALYTKPICISMLLTAACYLTAYFTLIPLYGNIGLWLAFLIFYIARSSFLLLFVPKLTQRFA
ncbi:MAG: MATE family efflux transporter [Phascolarctobacterium sp.]